MFSDDDLASVVFTLLLISILASAIPVSNVHILSTNNDAKYVELDKNVVSDKYVELINIGDKSVEVANRLLEPFSLSSKIEGTVHQQLAVSMEYKYGPFGSVTIGPPFESNSNYPRYKNNWGPWIYNNGTVSPI